MSLHIENMLHYLSFSYFLVPSYIKNFVYLNFVSDILEMLQILPNFSISYFFVDVLYVIFAAL